MLCILLISYEPTLIFCLINCNFGKYLTAYGYLLENINSNYYKVTFGPLETTLLAELHTLDSCSFFLKSVTSNFDAELK